jgi:hypothetical protein
MREAVIAFGIIGIATLVGHFAAWKIPIRFESEEEREARRAREEAYRILTDSMVEYKRTHETTHTFDDFLEREWPQDYKHYVEGMRSYDEWKTLYASV